MDVSALRLTDRVTWCRHDSCARISCNSATTGRILVLISPCIEPDSPYRFLIFPFVDSVLGRFPCGLFGLLWTIADQIPLNLMQKARLAKTPITMDAEHLRRRAAGDGFADFPDDGSSIEGVQQRRFVVVHDVNLYREHLAQVVLEYQIAAARPREGSFPSSQFSTCRFGTRPNSLTFAVTTVRSSASACAAMSMPFGPIVVPPRSR